MHHHQRRLRFSFVKIAFMASSCPYSFTSSSLLFTLLQSDSNKILWIHHVFLQFFSWCFLFLRNHLYLSLFKGLAAHPLSTYSDDVSKYLISPHFTLVSPVSFCSKQIHSGRFLLLMKDSAQLSLSQTSLLWPL